MTNCVLSQPTLVLNKSWVAIDTTSVMDALRLIARGAALAVQPDTYEVYGFESWADLAVQPDEPCVRTVRLQIPVPEVITLTRYNGIPTQSVTFTRRNLYKRDRYTCQYCGAQPGSRELTIDHVLPRSRGGVSTWDNCVLACLSCNHRKAAHTPDEAGLRMRSQPTAPRWRPTMGIPITRVRQSWEKFVSEGYWNVRLEP